MEYIGKRISILKKQDELSIVILSLKDQLKNKLLLLWVILWTACGLIVLTQYNNIADTGAKTVVIVWMGFWVYFEYKIIMAYKWRKSGSEKIRIKDGKLIYCRAISKKGKVKEYKTDFIKELRYNEPKENSFFENLNDSYWMLGNERLEFSYNGADIKMGIQLNEKESKDLLQLIKKRI